MNFNQGRIEQNAFLLGLLSKCLVRTRVHACPLADIAMKAIDEQLIFIENLSDRQIARILSYQQKCFAKYTSKQGREINQKNNYGAH